MDSNITFAFHGRDCGNTIYFMELRMENRTKKDMYNTSPIDMRTKVKIGDEEEIAMKPYYYYRNGLLHIRYTVDRCVELSPSEQTGLKIELSTTFDKQTVLTKAWNFFVTCVGKPIIRDGIAEMERRIEHFAEVNNGYKN